LIGRIRKDTKLYLPADQGQSHITAGRKRVYGARIPTPDLSLRICLASLQKACRAIYADQF
jgi:hypothetical protein